MVLRYPCNRAASLRAEFGLFHGNKQTTPFGSLNDPTGILGVTFTF